MKTKYDTLNDIFIELINSKLYFESSEDKRAKLEFKAALKAMDEYANIKMIEENQSILEMAKLHCDSRMILVIENRIKDLQSKKQNT